MLSYGFDEWRLQPTTPVNAQTPAIGRTTFKSTNPRTAAPEEVGGDIRLASLNVLNYFVHFGGEARGADDEAGLAKQEAKIVAAISALDADVVALEEIENSVRFEDDDPQMALERLVAALNTEDGAGTWDYVRSPAGLPAAAQQDFITTAIIFKPAAVTPAGESRTINDESVWFNAREPQAQTFVKDGDAFTVVANHFKSKSPGEATGDNVDTGDGQGQWNGDRVRQAASLAAFVAEVSRKKEESDVVLLGDFNAYTQEDPMQVLYDAGYESLGAQTEKFSYSYQGLSGSLDHVLASEAAQGIVTGTDIWNINAGESIALEYSRYNYNVSNLYDASPYRSSDHDPVIVGLDLSGGATPEPPVDTTTLQSTPSAGSDVPPPPMLPCAPTNQRCSTRVGWSGMGIGTLVQSVGANCRLIFRCSASLRRAWWS